MGTLTVGGQYVDLKSVFVHVCVTMDSSCALEMKDVFFSFIN